MAILSRKNSVWGLDIGTSAIKGVRMRADGDAIRILNADIVPLKGPAPATDSPGRDRRIWRALQEFGARNDMTSARVAVTLPGTVFFVRPFKLMLVGTRSEAELVQYEMEQHIPFGLDAVLWDHELFDSEDILTNERDGLLFAMKKEVLNNYFLSLAGGGVEPIQVQAAPLALLHFIRYELDPQEPVLVADIGATTTNLLAINGARYWLRAINIGGDMVTAAIQEAFTPRTVTRDHAERIKVSLPSLTRRTEIIERIRPGMRGFVGTLGNAITHLAQEHNLKFGRIIVMGGDSGMYGLSNLMTEQLGMRAIVPAGLGRIRVDEHADREYINTNLPSLAPAIGVGLQVFGKTATTVNLVGATLLRRRSQTMVRRIAASVLLCCVLLALVYGAFLSARKATLSGGLEALQNTIGPLEVRRRSFLRFTQPADAEQGLEAMHKMARERQIWLVVLDKIARILPDNGRRGVPRGKRVWLIRMSMSPTPGPSPYTVTLIAGTPYHTDGTHVQHTRRTLVPPLKDAAGGMFANIREVAAMPSDSLSLRSGNGPRKYWVVQIDFDVVPEPGDVE